MAQNILRGMKKILPFLIIVFHFNLTAQWENAYAFFGVGQAYYQGDLNATSFPTGEILNMSYKWGAGFNLHTRFGLTMHYTRSSVNGSDFFSSDNDRKARGLSFNSPIREFGLNFKIRNLTGVEGRTISYLFSGLNVFSFNPTVTRSLDSDINYAVEQGFPKSGVNIPFGLGFGYWFTGNIGLVGEVSLHTTFTDFIDGISKNGNPNFNDAFVDGHAILIFRFSEWEGTGKKSQRRSKGWSPGKVRSIKCPGL